MKRALIKLLCIWLKALIPGTAIIQPIPRVHHGELYQVTFAADENGKWQMLCWSMTGEDASRLTRQSYVAQAKDNYQTLCTNRLIKEIAA